MINIWCNLPPQPGAQAKEGVEVQVFTVLALNAPEVLLPMPMTLGLVALEVHDQSRKQSCF